MPRPPRVHYLRRNEQTRTPRRVLVLDCEASAIDSERVEVQVLRLWQAKLTCRPPATPRRKDREWYSGTTAEELADTVDALTCAKDPLWVFAHNLSYDLALTRLPLLLLDRGWELGTHNLASDGPWAILRRKGRTIRLADSASWLPVGVKVLSRDYGPDKRPLPAWEAPDEEWGARCRGDVETTSEALLALMAEFETRQLGNWSVTGSSAAWNTMLHWPSDKRVVIDPDPAARTFERSALYGGRREVQRWGELPRGQYLEVDMRQTHLAVCAHLPLPWRRSQANFSHLPLDHPAWGLNIGLLADCLVETRTPAYPVRVGRQVLYPTGRFRTRLAGPELREARSRGELLEVGRGYSYGLGGRLPEWAQWCEQLLDSAEGEIEPALRVFLKGASRSVPGRWAMQVARVSAEGESAAAGWKLEPISVGREHTPAYLFHFGGRWQQLVHDQEAEDAFPAVLAFIESHVRVLLRRALDALGPDAWLQCATDSILAPLSSFLGLLETEPRRRFRARDRGLEASALLSVLDHYSAPLRWRIKSEPRRLRLISPQHVERDGVAAFSGVPRNAEQPEPGVFRWWTWPRLKGQMERGDPRGYVRELRTVRLREIGLSRWAYEDGCTKAPQIAQEAREGCGNVLALPDPVCCHGRALRVKQGPALEQLLRERGARVSLDPGLPQGLLAFQ